MGWAMDDSGWGNKARHSHSNGVENFKKIRTTGDAVERKKIL